SRRAQSPTQTRRPAAPAVSCFPRCCRGSALPTKSKRKAFVGKGGHDVAKSIVEGRAELGTTFISEVLPVKGTKVVGPLPRELHNANTYTGAIHTRAALRDGAEALLHKLVEPATRSRWIAAGLEPAFPAR